jgi:anaerobic selenocysteine-containing dehydrogenase
MYVVGEEGMRRDNGSVRSTQTGHSETANTHYLAFQRRHRSKNAALFLLCSHRCAIEINLQRGVTVETLKTTYNTHKKKNEKAMCQNAPFSFYYFFSFLFSTPDGVSEYLHL